MQVDRPIVIALILFVILLLVFFLVVPEYNTFVNLRTELGEKISEYNAEFDYYTAITKMYYDLQARKDDLKKVDDALSPDPVSGRIIYFLQKIATDNGLILKNLFLSKSSSGTSETNLTNSIKDIIFSVDLVGDYSALKNFILSLEKSSRIFEITNISFGSASNPPYNFSLQIKTYSY